MDRAKLSTLHDLTGRVAIVTGGTRGIGYAIAEGLVAAGAKVAVASRKADACAAIEEHLRSQGGEAIGVATHMGDIDCDQRPRRPHRRRVRPAGHRRQQRGQCADSAVRSAHRGCLGEVARHQPARPGLPCGTGASASRSVGKRRHPERRLGRCVPVLREHRDVCGGQGRADGHDPVDGGRVRREGHPGERARARHGRHRHGPQQHAGSRSSRCPGRRSCAAPRTPTRWSARRCCCARTPGSFITGQVLIVDGGLTPH